MFKVIEYFYHMRVRVNSQYFILNDSNLFQHNFD